MKAAPFDYHAPTTSAEVIDMLTELEDARILAGGQSLVPMMALRLARFQHVIDVNRVPGLAGVAATAKTVRIGAMTRQSHLETDAEAARLASAFAVATPFVGHFQNRNRGTIGGSIAHADPTGEYTAVVSALDASMEIIGPRGPRAATADDFFRGTWTTAIEPDEFLVGVTFDRWASRSGFGVSEVARRHGDFAIAGAVAGVTLGAGATITRVSISMFGVADRPVRARVAESALIGTAADGDLSTCSALAVDGLTPGDDLHASSAYRCQIVPVVVRRALTDAIRRAKTERADD